MQPTRCARSMTQTKRPGRLYQPRGLALSGDGYRRHHRRSAAALAAVGRENLMIKVPATKPGLPAIRQLIGEGINVNITLLFSQRSMKRSSKPIWPDSNILSPRRRSQQGGQRRELLCQPHRHGRRQDHRRPPWRSAQTPKQRQELGQLRGKIAIANAKLAYQRYKRLFAGARWEALRAKGAGVQRLLWASTGVKNPAYRDVLYVEELIAPETVNTVPPATMEAFHRSRQSELDTRGQY